MKQEMKYSHLEKLPMPPMMFHLEETSLKLFKRLKKYLIGLNGKEQLCKSELNQLTEMGTWELVEHPKEVIPIANKWVFQKKYNQIGKMTKYKARLVVKGCSQCPGFDYNETYSPVV